MPAQNGPPEWPYSPATSEQRSFKADHKPWYHDRRKLSAGRYLISAQAGRRSGNAMGPTPAVIAKSTYVLSLHRARAPRLSRAMRMVNQSPIAILESSAPAPRIVPMAAA